MGTEAAPVVPAERVVRRMVGGYEFGFRRPSRGDIAEINRRYVSKLFVTGTQIESEILAGMDGEGLLWEARFQVCLRARHLTQGVIDLGEAAPDHWLRDGAVAFDKVDVDEFEAVVDAFAPLFAPRPPVTAPTGR